MPDRQRAAPPDLPNGAIGIGLRPGHYDYVTREAPDIDWLEVHSENYFDFPGPAIRALNRIREHYPIALHGVGLSLGSADALNPQHLRKLEELVQHIEPVFVSEHLCWNSVGGRYSNDLLPMPFTQEAVQHLVARIQAVQDRLQRRILVENVSSYLEYTVSEVPEWAFIAEVVERSGCGLLLDVNNVYVNAVNHGFDPRAYLLGIPAEAVQEIHLAGHSIRAFDGGRLLIDTHNQPVSTEVWALFEYTVKNIAVAPTLIEWDKDLPAFPVLEDEGRKARRIIEEAAGVPAA